MHWRVAAENGRNLMVHTAKIKELVKIIVACLPGLTKNLKSALLFVRAIKCFWLVNVGVDVFR